MPKEHRGDCCFSRFFSPVLTYPASTTTHGQIDGGGIGESRKGGAGMRDSPPRKKRKTGEVSTMRRPTQPLCQEEMGKSVGGKRTAKPGDDLSPSKTEHVLLSLHPPVAGCRASSLSLSPPSFQRLPPPLQWFVRLPAPSSSPPRFYKRTSSVDSIHDPSGQMQRKKQFSSSSKIN